MKKLLVASFCFSILFVFAPCLSAQTEGQTVPDSSAPEKINVFAGVQPAVSGYNGPVQHKIITPDWSLKCNPVILARGEVPVYLEHKLNQTWSAEAAIGITFTDFVKADILKGKSLFQKDPAVDGLSGICGKLALRYFPGHDAGSDLYLSSELDYTSYRKDVKGVYMDTDGRYTDGKLRDAQQYVDLKALIGWQNSDPFESDFSFDWYVGAGIRVGSENNVVPDERNANVIVLNHSDVVAPILALGVKIGLGF
jgi:hypothetical protein